MDEKRILLVEDEDNIALALEHLLRRQGFGPCRAAIPAIGSQTLTSKEQRLCALSMTLAVTKPLPQELVELIFFVRLQHLLVRVRIHPAKTTTVIGRHYLGKAGVVIQAYLHARWRYPALTPLVRQLQR